MSYEDARNWLTDYPRHAAAGLLPVALGKQGKDRDCARQALRLLVNLNQRETIEEIAQGYNQPDVLAALATLFDGEPLEEYPLKSPHCPAFISSPYGADHGLKVTTSLCQMTLCATSA